MWPFTSKRARDLARREKEITERENRVNELSLVGHAVLVNPTAAARSERNRKRIQRLKAALRDLEQEGQAGSRNHRRLTRELQIRELAFEMEED